MLLRKKSPKQQWCNRCGYTRPPYTMADGYCHQCHMRQVRDILYNRKTMTPDELYEMGYADAKAGKAANASYVHDSNYELGYTDGRGDREARPVGDMYTELNDPPVGFVFTGEKRTPDPGEWYLSKNGNAIKAKKVRGNNQTRYILIED